MCINCYSRYAVQYLVLFLIFIVMSNRESADDSALGGYMRALKEALEQIPQSPNGYDGENPTQDTVAQYQAAFAEWGQGLPTQPNPYETDRR